MHLRDTAARAAAHLITRTRSPLHLHLDLDASPLTIFIIMDLQDSDLSDYASDDFPEEVKWLTDEEREFVRAKLARDVGKSAHHAKLGLKEVLDVFKDCKSISQTFGHQQLCMGLQFYREGYYWRFHVFRPHRSSIWLVVQVLSNRMNMSNVSRLCLLRSDYYSVFWL